MDAWSALSKIAPGEPESIRDNQWVDTTNKANAAEAARLEAQLKGYKNNLIKESIRVSNFLYDSWYTQYSLLTYNGTDGKRGFRQTL